MIAQTCTCATGPRRPSCRRRIAGLNTAARIIVFTCIENPIADPIYLIRADEVINEMPADKKIFCMNRTSISSIDGPLTYACNSEPGNNKSILHRGTDWLSFDPSRVCPANIDTLHNSVMGALLRASEKVASTSARKIVLRRGDALIVDNYRALTRRQQHGYPSFVSIRGCAADRLFAGCASTMDSPEVSKDSPIHADMDFASF